jgi:hypothetical protein
MIPTSLMPWKIIAVVVAIAGVFAWHMQRVRGAYADGLAAGRADVQARWDAEKITVGRIALAAESTRRATEQQRFAALQKEIEDAHQATERARADADRSRSAVGGLRRDARALAARRCPAGGDPALAAGGAAATDPGLLLAELLGGLAEAGGELALEADRRGIAGGTCERAYPVTP